MFKKILVPLDGSELAETVLPYVSQLAKRIGAEVILLRVVPSPVREYSFPGLAGVSMPPLPPSPTQDLHAQGEGYLQRVAFDYFPDQNVTLEVLSGPTADTILELAAAQEVGLIAMTTRGRGGLMRMVLGSVADQVVRLAHIPVLLVRPQGAPAH